MSDGGWYQCDATNKAGTSSLKVINWITSYELLLLVPFG